MINYRILVVLALFLLIIPHQASAQSKALQLVVFTGLNTPLLDNGIGLQLGLNPYVESKHLYGAELSAAYSYTNIKGTFLSGNPGHSNSIQLLAGPRLYFTSKEKKYRPFINALVGIHFTRETINGKTGYTEHGLAFSGGIFLQVKKWESGIYLSYPNYLGLKLGYSL